MILRTLIIAILITLPQTFFLAANVFGQVETVIEEGDLTGVIEDEQIWKGSFAAGLNGKTGNSQNVDINFALNMTRETDFATTNILANYFYASNNIATTTDRWFSQARQEINLSNPRWSWFNQLGVEIDRFKAYDYRVALHSGLAFKLIDEETRKIKLRLGAGASREVGGVNDDWLPELQLGGDWERQVFESTRVFASFDYFPNFSDFGDYRLNTNAGLDFLVNEARNINFRIFAQNRYDSTPPPGNESSDLDYGAALVVGF
jgi:putative salt-induced outer membrane protein YdiY